MNSFSKRSSVIHLEDGNDLAYWTKKWGVNVKQINEAILETGSIKLEDIRNVLRKKGIVGLSFWIRKFFKDPLLLH